MRVRRGLARGLIRLAGWKSVGTVPPSGIMVGAPHTSNWDWVATVLLLWSHDVSPRVLIKQDLFKGPLGMILRARSEEHTSELQSLMRISYAVFCLNKKKQ